jgi:hypothetical protein
LEEYAACFDDLFNSLAQRRGFREYLTSLLAPRDQNKTLTCQEVADVEQATGRKPREWRATSPDDPPEGGAA